MKNVRVGLFGIGLEAYWSQFEGLEARLCGYVDKLGERLQRPGVDVVNLGMIDTPEKALEAGHRFRREDVRTAYILEHNRMALMGHYYQGMLDIYSDITRMSAVFWTHYEIVEMDELSALRRGISEDEVKTKISEFREKLDVGDDCSEEEIERAARTAVALDQLVVKRNLHKK